MPEPSDPATADPATDDPAADPSGEESSADEPAPMEPPVVAVPDTLTFAEPNDGELLGGSVLAVRMIVEGPFGSKINIYSGTTLLGTTMTLVPDLGAPPMTGEELPRLATVYVDTSQLENGVEELRAELRDDLDVSLDERTRSYIVDHPIAEVLDTDFQCCTLQGVTISVASATPMYSSVPYLVLSSRTTGAGEFAGFGMVLQLPPSNTSIIHGGILPWNPAGPSVISVPINEEQVSESAPVHLVVMVLVDGEWKTTGALSITH